MATEAERADFAQLALDAFIHAEGADRRWTGGEPACDIVDLMTDLLLLAKRRGYDPCTVIGKVERHLKAETGEIC
ncbi:hypothetical protein [Methylobacterium oxalidis]|uniref:Uncharacterized protein n=1 Tax=Methylobacterium oxalidis TaxID=944322 RepID=A0A512J4E8_9HYPH|nr:hypothetical protein [Methylobacterium oxalidis]GEP04834.1 hypothetical protein MOX02_28720 [Methylobacterium oxalidis]GLS63659.1 hypothetical protein GCM10007888_20400 [Methylobacterium oxalidis]